MHDFPAGRFAVWATAWLSGRSSYDEALDGLLGETAHRVTGLPGTAEAVPLGWALTALRGAGERRFRLVLPVPGDVRGLPRVPGLAALALESGQAAVGEHLVFVPEEIGPEAVAWTVFPLVDAPPPLPEGSLRAAAGALDLAIRDAARALVDLDLARWHPEVPALLAGLAKPSRLTGLPPDHDRWRSRCWRGRSGWRRCWTWRWPTRRAPRSRTPRPPRASTPCARCRPPCGRRRSPPTTPSRARTRPAASRRRYGRAA